jgi:O-succinylbenzoic acid--CoA ligase
VEALQMGITEFESNDFCADWLRSAAQQQPAASALVLKDASFDYASLQSLTAQLCQALRAQGLKPGATLVVESRCATLLVFLLHAALFADFVLFPLDPRLPDGQRKRLLERVRADLILSENDAVRLSQLIQVMTVGSLLAQAGQAESMCAAKSPAPPDRPRLLLATSGSSGLPKLVKLSDSNLQASVRAANERLNLSHTSVWLDCLPLVHIGGLSILLRCACAGASVVLREGFDAPDVMDDLHNHPVSHISLVPAMLAQLLDLAKAPSQSLQVVLVGGAPLEPSLANRALAAGWPVWVTYGMTETASMLTARKLGTEEDNPRQVGSPLPGFELRIVDEVIQVRGAAVHDSGTRLAGQWLSTGDRGQLDKAGRLTLMGRTDSMLLSGGEKVYPELVEQLLANYPGIDEVAVTGQADPVWGERVVAVYRGDIDEAALAQLCRDGIEGAMRPRAFVKVESLPRTTNGKLDRSALRALVADRR